MMKIGRYLLVESNVHKADLCTESTTRDKKTHLDFNRFYLLHWCFCMVPKLGFDISIETPHEMSIVFFRFFGPRNLEETQPCPMIFSNGFPILKHIPANQQNTLRFPKSFKIEVYLG